MTVESKDLLTIFEEYSPKLLSNGQIRTQCPFRENHTDGSGEYSFFISPDINAYHCFSCREHGNLVRLLTKRFSVNYFEAVELVKLTDYHKEKVSFDLDILWEKKPPKSFLDRGFTKETLKKFQFGVDDEGWSVIPFLKEGKLVGYQRRVDFPDRITVNSKHFDKEHYIYNHDPTKDTVIVVEGYSDVMRLNQFGFHAESVLGSYVSTWQAEQFSKRKIVYSAFDNDEAGRRATEILYHRIKNHTEVRFIPYTTKDPGECRSRRKWLEAFNNATDYAEYSLEMALHLDGYLEMRAKVIQELQRDYGIRV